MQYNKYQIQYLDIDAQQKVICQKIEDLQDLQNWYKNFDLDDAALNSRNARKLGTKFNNEIRQHQLKIILITSEIKRLNEKTSLGWNPKYWFSDERAKFKVELKSKLNELSQLEDHVDWLKSQVKAKNDIVLLVESNLKKYKEHDPLLSESTISALSVELGALSKHIQEVARQRDELDVLISAPLAELKKLTSHRSSVVADLKQAQSMDDQMSRAANSYERAQLHERSKQTLGDSSPRKVKGAKERELEGIDRNIKKLQMRLESIVERSSRTIRRLIIDGNNLCYLQRHGKFIGLSALRPISNLLSEKYEVIIVFDASIGDQLRKNTQQIIDCFSNRIYVHIVSTGEKADESLLKIASEPDDWVISGDRFSDYPEMQAVKNKKLIRPEILEEKILINDLGVDMAY